MSTSVAQKGLQLLSLALEDTASRNFLTHETTKKKSNNHKEAYVEFLLQGQGNVREKMLGGQRMQQVLSDQNYKCTSIDSLSVEMARQKDIMQEIQQNSSRHLLPAGALSDVHFDVGDSQVLKAKHQGRIRGKRIIHKDGDSRDPILAKGNLKIAYGHDISVPPLLRRRTVNARRNIITGEGNYNTYGFDSIKPIAHVNIHRHQSSTSHIF